MAKVRFYYRHKRVGRDVVVKQIMSTRINQAGMRRKAEQAETVSPWPPPPLGLSAFVF